jgi:hypothetical protein
MTFQSIHTLEKEKDGEKRPLTFQSIHVLYIYIYIEKKRQRGREKTL